MRHANGNADWKCISNGNGYGYAHPDSPGYGYTDSASYGYTYSEPIVHAGTDNDTFRLE